MNQPEHRHPHDEPVPEELLAAWLRYVDSKHDLPLPSVSLREIADRLSDGTGVPDAITLLRGLAARWERWEELLAVKRLQLPFGARGGDCLD